MSRRLSRITCLLSRISGPWASRRLCGLLTLYNIANGSMIDFDLTIQRFAFSSTPGDSLRSYFSSQAAAMKGSQNLAGISDPIIDALIDKIIAADSRESLTMACRVLDRVIRAGRYWVPHWYKASHWLAYWD